MKKYIILFVTIAFTSVIFIHSSMSAETSTVESDAAFSMWDSISQFVHIPNFLTAISIRKAAHFVQFTVFGILLTSTVISFCGNIKNQIFKILFFLLAVPVTDEFIQYFPEGRSAQVSDVVLDFSGCIMGLAVTAAVFAFFVMKKHRKSSVQTK